MEVHGGWVLRIVRGAALAVLLLAGWGCGDDEGGVSLTDQTPGNWTLLVPGQANDPAYGPAGGPGANYLAFSSFRTSASVAGAPAGLSEEDLGDYSHIWLQHTDGTQIQVSHGSNNDVDPAWSPSGSRLCFTRDNGARRDIYWVDVSDPANPGTPVRITDRTIVLAGATEGDWIVADGQEQVVFSDGTDIFRIPVSGGSPIKIIPDPGDQRPPECGGATFPDMQPSLLAGGNRIAFVSIGRSELGTLTVRTKDQTGVPTLSEIWLQGCAQESLIVEDSVATFTGLPHGDYRIRGLKRELGFCDTLDLNVTLENDALDVDLVFEPHYGTILARAFSINPSDFGYLVDCEYTESIAHPAVISDPLTFFIFTPIPCVPEGVRIVSGTQASRVDSAWVNVLPNVETEVTLTFLDSTQVDSLQAEGGASYDEIPYPRGGEGNFYWRRCPEDSICIDYDTTIVGIDTTIVCAEWDCSLPWQRDWVQVDTLCSGPLQESPGLAWGHGEWAPTAPAQGDEEIWTYDITTGAFGKPLGSTVAQKPVWDPTGANRIAYITRSGGYFGVRILNMDTGRIVAIALPGLDGPFLCGRDAIAVSWSSDGRFLAVSIGPCSGGQYPRDLQIYTVDLQELGLA